MWFFGENVNYVVGEYVWELVIFFSIVFMMFDGDKMVVVVSFRNLIFVGVIICF